MGFKARANSVQLKLTGALSVLTYGYFSHMNQAGVDTINITDDDQTIDLSNIGNINCNSELIRALIHGYQSSYNTTLISDDTVCDPKYIPCNCIMKDKNGYIQYGAGDELFIDYPLAYNYKKEWILKTFPSSKRWSSVCYGNGKFVAVANNTNYYAYSTDGINWTEGTISDTNRYWNSICYGNGKFVVIDWNSTNIIAYSTDGINWTEGTISSTGSRYWNSICYGNGKFVTISSSDYFAYSTDAITWIEGTVRDNSSGSYNWNSICYGNDKFVAVAINGTKVFVYSTDGIHWTEGNLPISKQWYSVCYGNDKFVAVGNSNLFVYSTDGINWNTSNYVRNKRWKSVCYGNGKYISIAYPDNYFAYSTDGITWYTDVIDNTSIDWQSVCYGNDKFIAVANNSDVFAYSYSYPLIEFDRTKSIYNDHLLFMDQYPDGRLNFTTESPIGNNKYLDANLNIIDSDGNICCIPVYKYINGNDYLIDSIGGNCFKYISNYFAVNSSGEYISDQFYRYIAFSGQLDETCLAITSDLMHFTTYRLNSNLSNYSIAVKDGILFMYISEKDAVAMITRHPITTDVITIDGNDPENTTDYSKPYYRLIEIPFLKKYYKYSGKHVENVAIGVIGSMANDTYIFGSNKYLSDYTLIINVFDRTYRIGVPNFNSNDSYSYNSKKLQEFYTYDDQISDSLSNMNVISQIISRYDSSTTNISCNVNSRHFDVITDSNINITTDQMNIGYDSDIDETTPSNINYISNYTYCGANSISDISTPESVIYPNVNY